MKSGLPASPHSAHADSAVGCLLQLRGNAGISGNPKRHSSAIGWHRRPLRQASCRWSCPAHRGSSATACHRSRLLQHARRTCIAPCDATYSAILVALHLRILGMLGHDLEHILQWTVRFVLEEDAGALLVAFLVCAERYRLVLPIWVEAQVTVAADLAIDAPQNTKHEAATFGGLCIEKDHAGGTVGLAARVRYSVTTVGVGANASTSCVVPSDSPAQTAPWRSITPAMHLGRLTVSTAAILRP